VARCRAPLAAARQGALFWLCSWLQPSDEFWHAWQGSTNKCSKLEKSLKELQELFKIAQPEAFDGFSAASEGNDDGLGSSSSSMKRPADSEGAALLGALVSKRSRPSPQKDATDSRHQADATRSLDMEEDVDDVPMEMRVAVLRTRAVERESEVKRLRGLLHAREMEFSQERKQLVSKLMASEQARREGDAALETNDAMWQQLVQNQMALLQQKVAAQQQKEEGQQQSDSLKVESAVAEIGGQAQEEEEKEEAMEEPEDEMVKVELELESKDEDEKRKEADMRQEKVDEEEEEVEEKETQDGVDVQQQDAGGRGGRAPLSPASSLVAHWKARRKTLGGI